MDTLQTWIVVGVPGLVTAVALFVGRSRLRALIGYAVLLAVVIAFLMVPDAISAAVVGIIAFLLVAIGRGQTDDQYLEHHENRERFTVADEHA